MKRTIVLILLLMVSTFIFSQTRIKMKRQGGVSIIPCKVNGLDLELIFDTGATDISISLTEATLMLRNGQLTKNDIIGTSNYVNATGDIFEGIVINIKEIEIAGLKLKNIKASVVKNLDAPLLLGQTAISKLGKIQLDLNNNTLIILNGKGAYDYSLYSLTDKIEKYYSEFSIEKIEKKDNNEGMHFSYTVPQKWSEQKATNPSTFKSYYSDEYPYSVMYQLKIGLQTMPSLYDNYEKCQKFVEQMNGIGQKLDPSYKLISISKTNISFCKTIKNITSTKREGINVYNIQYFIFVGNKLLRITYSVLSLDLDKIISISNEFDDFCNSQISNIIVYNALENEVTCTIQSNAVENNKDISIILNNACNWFKSEGNNELNIKNHFTSSTLGIGISDKINDLPNLEGINSADLLDFQKSFIETIGNSLQILSSDILTLNKKKFIHFSAKDRNNTEFILTEFYYYIINNRLITIVSFVQDEDEKNVISRFDKSKSDLKDLLMGIEIISKESLNWNDYFTNGISKVQSNDYKGAILDFNKAIELNPKIAEVYYNRGIAKFNQKDNEGAIADFNKAISINPTLMQFYYNRGIVRIQLQNFKGALADFNKTIELQSDFADAYLNRGLIKIILGTIENGCIDLNKANVLGSANADKAIKLYCN